jgi:hypothetical protein
MVMMMIMMMMGVAIPPDRNVIQENGTKLNKKESNKFQQMLYMKCFVIPVICGTTETVRKDYRIPEHNARNVLNSLIGNITHKECAAV